MALGPIMLDLAGTELSEEDRELLLHPAVGGVIIFARNYQNPAQLLALTQHIRALRSPHLLITVDQEGGRVQRFRDGFQRLPPASDYGKLYQHAPDKAQRLVQLAAWLMASELQAYGVDFSFAPVLDLDYGLNQVVGNRAFSHDPEISSVLAGAWMQGVRLAGMISVGKHFPGHGGVSADSHFTLPVDERPFDVLWQQDLLPFRRLVEKGVEVIMPAHIMYKAVDNYPAFCSQHWLQQILRQKMGFQGVIISDALDMAGAASIGDAVTRAKAALQAGCEQLLMCNDRVAAIKVVEALADYQDLAVQARLARLYSRHFMSIDVLQQHPYWEEAQRMLARLADGDVSQLAYDPTMRGGAIV